eukprot:jgi/Mesen1/1504/ME000132S00444
MAIKTNMVANSSSSCISSTRPSHASSYSRNDAGLPVQKTIPTESDREFSLNTLPAECLTSVLAFLPSLSDRNAFAICCKHFLVIEAQSRKRLILGSNLSPVEQALDKLLARFGGALTSIAVDYSWRSHSRAQTMQQLDDRGIYSIATRFSHIREVNLTSCRFLTDSGLHQLAYYLPSLEAFSLTSLPKVTAQGLLAIAQGHRGLRSLEVERCMRVGPGDWLPTLGSRGTLEKLKVNCCSRLQESCLAMLGLGWTTLQELHFELEKEHQQEQEEQEDLSGMALPGAPNGCWQDYFPQGPYVLKHITAINCSSNCTGEGPLEWILQRCRSLESFRTANSPALTQDSIFKQVVESNARLKKISIRSRNEASMVAGQVSESSLCTIASHSRALEELELSGRHGMSPTHQEASAPGSTSPAEALLAVLRSCTMLRTLLIERCTWLNDSSLQVLSQSKHLSRLQLHRIHGITDESLRYIARSCPSVTSLQLRLCRALTDKGLAHFIQARHLLKELVVEGCPDISKEAVKGATKCAVAVNAYGRSRSTRKI